jgi:hypothetical protein
MMSVRFAVSGALIALIAFGACDRNRPFSSTTAEPTPTPVPLPTPPPAPYVPNKRLEIGRLFNGFRYKVTLATENGTTAAVDRDEPESYTVEVQVKVKVPKPHHDLAEITRLNSELVNILPELPALLDTAVISPVFDNLYRLKVASLQRSLNRLDGLLSRHNFFDCETVLELQHPKTKRRAVFIQSDMDVDTDGSDSDRVPNVDGSSLTFQPFTSYKWDKKTPQQNAFIAPREAELKTVELELATKPANAARVKELKETQSRLKGEIADLKKYSYLIAATDPFIVLPGVMFGKKTPFTPAIGDYCAVIYNDAIYPAIVGDVGPAFKMGESSLRICRQLNARADMNNRPTSDLKVTYLVFPGSADKPWAAPDLEKWRARCESLLGELGGFRGTLFAWDDLTKPKPPPAPPPPPPPLLPSPIVDANKPKPNPTPTNPPSPTSAETAAPAGTE